jgi:hypothetical protein
MHPTTVAAFEDELEKIALDPNGPLVTGALNKVRGMATQGLKGRTQAKAVSSKIGNIRHGYTGGNKDFSKNPLWAKADPSTHTGVPANVLNPPTDPNRISRIKRVAGNHREISDKFYDAAHSGG